MKMQSALRFAAIGLVGSIALAGCAVNTEGPEQPGETVSAEVNAELAAKVPADLKDRGVIEVGISPGAAPSEFKNSAGDIIGLDPDLFTAIAAVLGLKVNYVDSKFDNIIPGVLGGKYDVGVSAFTDTFEREKTLDFVTYFNAGSAWATLAGKPVDPTDACGKSVAVLIGVFQELETLPAKSTDCVAAGKEPIDIQAFDGQDQTVTAVLLGKADAVIGDSPAIAYAVQQSDGKLELSGELEDSAPAGYLFPKDSELAPVIQQALQSLIDDGTYQKILDSWNLGSGALTEAKINDAVF